MTPQNLRVLTYHRVMEPRLAAGCDPALISATPEGFEEQMERLATRYRVVSAEQVAEARQGGAPLPARAVLITFDDATADFAEVAWPILRRWGLKATLFVPTAYPGRRDLAFWWDRLYCAIAATTRTSIDAGALGTLKLETRRSRQVALRTIQRWVKATPHAESMEAVDRLCRDLGVIDSSRPAGDVLTWNKLRLLAAQGVSLGAHTHTHPAMTQVSVTECREEIRRSRDILAANTGRVPCSFAYPFGDHDDTVVELVRDEGFAFAVTCVDGQNGIAEDGLRLRRTNVTRRTSAAILGLRLTATGARFDQWRHRPRPASRTTRGAGQAGGDRLKVAYVMSRFPKISETFVLNEILSVAATGTPIEIYPLIREHQPTMHPEVAEWVERAHFSTLFAPGLIRAHAHFLVRQPLTYLRAGVEVLQKTWGSTNFFIGAIGTFPKAVRFAYDMRRDGIRHVHAHFATHPALAGLIIHRLTGIPFSFTAHGSDLHVDRRMLDTKVAASAFAVTISSFNKEVMVRECGEALRDRIHVVHCGVDPEYFTPRRTARVEGPLRIVCVASLEEVKGHAFLIEACRLLIQRGVSLRCELVGDGPLRRTIEAQIARADLQQQVILHGPRTRPEVMQLLALADVAVLASHPTKEGKREGIPVALMEAMAAELPVVSTQISGIPELVESGVTGLLVPSGEPVALANALEYLAADSALRTQMGKAGRAKVEREFNLATNSQQLLHLFSASTMTRPPAGVSAPVASLVGG